MGGILQEISYHEKPEWLNELRLQGRAAFERQGLPTPKTEAWKYTKLREFDTSDYEIQSFLPDTETDFSVDIPFDCYKIHFRNGELSQPFPDLPAGVTLKQLSEAQAFLNHLADVNRYPFAALNTYYLNQGFLFEIKAGIKLDKPLAVIYHTQVSNVNLLENIHNIYVASAKSEFDLIEYYHYSGDVKSRYFLNQVNEFFVGESAIVNHYKFQNDAFKANHIALQMAEQQTGSRYHSFCLQKGANIARNETRVRLLGKEACAQVDAAYLMNGWATIDTTTDIEHLVPETYSSQLVKGVVGGDAKGVFQGKIHIAPHAVKTEGKQLHKALLLSDNAEIDVKPELEIFADDVKCSHGAATGELDEEQLFYMQSRGINREEAKRLLIEAYLEDVFCRICSEPIRDWFKGLK